jgi:hypothetical protein
LFFIKQIKEGKKERMILGLWPIAPVEGKMATGNSPATVILFTCSPSRVYTDTDFAIDINIGEVTGLSADIFEVTFDLAVLKLEKVTEGLIGNTRIPMDMAEQKPGNYIILQKAPGTDGAGTLATLHFHVVGKAGQKTKIAFSGGMMANNLAQEIPSDWEKCSVTLKILDQADSGTEDN